MNKYDYQSALSGVHHSDGLTERIMDMTYQKRNAVPNRRFKRLAAAALALVLFIGGSIGINYFTNQSNDLTVLVAYAGDNGELYFGGKCEQQTFYGIYTAPTSDKQACEEAAKRWQKDKAKILNKMDEDVKKGSSSTYGSGGFGCYNKDGEETAVLYTLSGGDFELNLEDYSDVKSFRVNNVSEYGLLQFECDPYTPEEESKLAEFSEKIDAIEDNDEREAAIQKAIEEGKIEDLQAHEFELTGDELRRSQNNGYGEKGLGRYKTNKGYCLLWEASETLADAITENPNFDLSQIKDTITFTVTFNDGTVKTASLNLYFDSDGYMHFS